jgi:hypothetical protein
MICDMAIIIYAILAIELTLDWSNISGVYNADSVGQLIPFIIGAVGLFRTVHSILIDRFTPESPVPANSSALQQRSRPRSPRRALGFLQTTPARSERRQRSRSSCRSSSLSSAWSSSWSSSSSTSRPPHRSHGPLAGLAALSRILGECFSQRLALLKESLATDTSLHSSGSRPTSSDSRSIRLRKGRASVVLGTLSEIDAKPDHEAIELPSGNIQVFPALVISRRRSISEDEEARDYASRLPFRPSILILDPAAQPVGNSRLALPQTIPKEHPKNCIAASTANIKSNVRHTVESTLAKSNNNIDLKPCSLKRRWSTDMATSEMRNVLHFRTVVDSTDSGWGHLKSWDTNPSKSSWRFNKSFSRPQDFSPRNHNLMNPRVEAREGSWIRWKNRAARRMKRLLQDLKYVFLVLLIVGSLGIGICLFPIFWSVTACFPPPKIRRGDAEAPRPRRRSRSYRRSGGWY